MGAVDPFAGLLRARSKESTEMNNPGIFIAGMVVTAIVFTGAFLYAMCSFGRWADRE
jgi:hypothetical protein